MNNSPTKVLVTHSTPRCLEVRIINALLLACLSPLCGQGAFVPLAISPESFNHDLVVESGAPPPLSKVTTASMDAGWENSGYSWYQRGYHADWPATGLPAPGTIIASDLVADHTYQFATDYRAENGILVDHTTNTAEIRLVRPLPYTALSLLLSGMHNGGVGVLGVLVCFQDGSTEPGTVSCPDWRRSGYAAYTAHGRVNVADFTFAQVNGDVPKLYTADIPLTNTTNPVTRVLLSHVSGLRSVVFGLSGRSKEGETYTPIPISGYNADLIVEASAVRPQWLAGVTTATMESGALNTLWTWFEQGYSPATPLAGLPPAGRILTNRLAPDLAFAIPRSYAARNALLLDADTPAGDLSLLAPARLQAVSFLAASGHGPTTNQCVCHYADGLRETNVFVAPHWMTSAGAFWSAGGRVNVNNRLLDQPAAGAPSLFAVEVVLQKSDCPVTNLSLSLLSPVSGAQTVIFALSGRTDPTDLRRALVSIRPTTPPGALLIESSEPGTLESAGELPGPGTLWTDQGRIEQTRTVQSSAGCRFWRVRQ